MPVSRTQICTMNALQSLVSYVLVRSIEAKERLTIWAKELRVLVEIGGACFPPISEIQLHQKTCNVRFQSDPSPLEALFG